MTSEITRIPKWIMYEPFSIAYNPERPHFVVTIDGEDDYDMVFVGSGNTIAEAAKEARKKRDGVNQKRHTNPSPAMVETPS